MRSHSSGTPANPFPDPSLRQSRPSSIVGLALKFGATSGLAMVAVFVRETVVLHHYGATPETDSFYLTLGPLALCSWMFMSLGEVRLVPTLSRTARARVRGYDVDFLTLGALIAVFWAIAAIIALPLTNGTRFASLPWMLAIEAIAVVPYAAFGSLRSALLAREETSVANLATAAANVAGVSLILIWLVPAALPLSLVVVSTAQFAIALVAVERGSTTHASRHPEVRRGAVALAVSMFLTSAPTSIDRSVAATLGPGSITGIALADRIYQVPATLTSFGLVSAMFPRMSRAIDEETARLLADQAVRLTWAFTLPMACAAVVFSSEAVWLIGGGTFAKSSVGPATTTCVALLGATIPAYVLSLVYARILLAAGNERAVVAQGILSFIAKVAFDIVGARAAGLPGIAAATLAMYLVSDSYFLAQLRRLAWTPSTLKLVIATGFTRDALAMVPGITVMVGARLAHLPTETQLIVGGVGTVAAIGGAVLRIHRAVDLGRLSETAAGPALKSTVAR